MFGLKALALGRGRSLISKYSDKVNVIRDAVCLGLSIVGISLVFSLLIGLEPLYLSVLILTLTFSLSRIISFIEPVNQSQSKISKDEEVTDDEIKSMLEDRGLDRLIDEKNFEDNKSSE